MVQHMLASKVQGKTGLQGLKLLSLALTDVISRGSSGSWEGSVNVAEP